MPDFGSGIGFCDEVCCTCPVCKGTGVMKIPRISIQCRNYDLEDFSTVAYLSNKELIELSSHVVRGLFDCTRCCAIYSWEQARGRDLSKEKLFKYLFGGEELD